MIWPDPLRGAIAGAVHGVAEWLPVSSSGHVALLIDAAGWPEARDERRQERRALEVALHTGSLLPIGQRVLGDLRAAERPVVLVAAGLAATGITSVIGGLAGPAVERRFAGPRSVAAGLVAGSVALLAAERRGVQRVVSGHVPRPVAVPNERAAPHGAWSARENVTQDAPCHGASVLGGTEVANLPRSIDGLTAADVVAVGVAQGLAIWPGVSRRAATLAAARARGLDPAAADTLSWATGFPTLAAATVWQFWRARRAMLAAPAAPLTGAAASAVVGHLTRSLPARTASWPAARWALWRVALAALTLARR